MERNVAKRLGATKSTMFTVGGVAGLKDHKFFKGLRWDRLLNSSIYQSALNWATKKHQI